MDRYSELAGAHKKGQVKTAPALGPRGHFYPSEHMYWTLVSNLHPLWQLASVTSASPSPWGPAQGYPWPFPKPSLAFLPLILLLLIPLPVRPPSTSSSPGTLCPLWDPPPQDAPSAKPFLELSVDVIYFSCPGNPVACVSLPWASLCSGLLFIF